MPSYDRSVFINVPFDRRYQKLLDALVFTVHECGFFARCALESDDGGEVRVEKLFSIIGQCQFGIHDLSRTTLDAKNRLPRFNMPLELGMFLGAKRYGAGRQRQKRCLILERDQYRYQKYCSDISGQDLRAHHNRVDDAISAVRNWLRSSRPDERFPGDQEIARRYLRFRYELPAMCRVEGLNPSRVPFLDYRVMVRGWLEENPR